MSFDIKNIKTLTPLLLKCALQYTALVIMYCNEKVCGFGSYRVHGSLCVVSVVCCQVEVSATD